MDHDLAQAMSARTGQERDPVPLYHRIYLVLREQILEGRFEGDRPMPSEIELGVIFRVSRVTIRKALARLDADGYVVRQRGRGTFANPLKTSRPIAADVRGLMENLLTMGLTTSVDVLSFQYVEASGDVAVDLGIEPAALVQRAVRLRHYKGHPLSYATTYVPEDVGRSYTFEEFRRTPLLSLFKRAGIQVASGHQRVSARAADATTSPYLQVDLGAPLLLVTRLVRDQDRRAIELIRTLYRPDRYEFEIDLVLEEGPTGSLWGAAEGNFSSLSPPER